MKTVVQGFFNVKNLYKIVVITIGSFSYSIGVVWFLNVASLYASGLAGILQLIVNTFSAFLHIELNLGVLVFIANIPGMVLGWKKFGKKFIMYSIYAVTLQSIIIGIIPTVQLLDNSNGIDLLTYAIVGGMCTGIGGALCLRVGGSSGGTDIFFQYFQFKTHISIGTYGLILNSIIIFIAGIIFGWQIAIYTIIRLIITSVVLDKINTVYNYLKLEVITNQSDELVEELLRTFYHGITIMDGKGAYSKQEKMFLYTIISSYELNRFIRIVKKYDSEAFVGVSNVKNVIGNFNKKVIE